MKLRSEMPGPMVKSIARSTFTSSAFRGLLAAAVLAGSVSVMAAAEQGWTPVVVPLAKAKPARQPGASGPLPAAEPPSRRLQASPADIRLAQQTGPSGVEAAPERTPKPVEAGSAAASPAQQYCVNITDAAADARFAWQQKTLTDIQQELDKRIAMLEAKTAEYQKWLARRDEFSKKAQESLVHIYSRMRPDAAASQLVAMDEETAAAVLTKLDPRNASLILNEMPPAQAARLTGTIAGAARVIPDRKKKS